MKPSLRLFQTLLHGALRGRVGPLEESVTRWRVLPSDLDLFGHMNNSRYLAMMDLGRVDLLVRAGLLPQVLRHRWVVPVGETSLQFRDSLRLFESYELGTRLVSWDEQWLYFQQEFRRPSEPGRPVVTGHVRAVFRDANGTVPPAQVLRSVAGHEVPVPSVSPEERRGLTRVASGRADVAPAREPLAIVGIGCRLPGGIEDADGFWKVLMDGRECIVDIPEGRWDAKKFHDASGRAPGRTYVQRAGLLQQDLREFEPAFFGITPREANTLDPQQRLMLEVSWEALEDAGLPPSTLAGSRTGVFVGGFMMDNLILHASPDNRERLDSHSATASTLTMLSNRLSYFYDLRGPSVSLDTACSSSLVALHLACQSLWAGESEAALVGGVNVLLLPETQVTMSKGKFLSPRGRCHAFSDQADGYVRAEGAAVLVIKPLSAALRDGNPIHSLILGTAVNQDGRTPGITVPNADAQVAVMREAYAKAGVDPSRVAYVEAHGTGTPVGDPIEARAIGTVAGAGRADSERCRLGSVKTNLGHLEAAAGVAGVMKAALVLEHGLVPPHPHLGRVNPKIPLESLGLHIPTRPEALPRGSEPRFAGVNSFGYGGTNAHVVLAEPPPRAAVLPPRRPEGRPHLLVLGAKSNEALSALAERYASWLEEGRGTPEQLCRDAAVHRSHPRHRLALRGANREALVQSLRAIARGARDVPGLDFVAEPAEARRKVLFVYTGMGPQWWAMGRQLLSTERVFREAVEECDGLFRELAGWSIAEELKRDASSSRITRTEVAQPANAVLQVALTRLWASWGVVPDGVVGHSIGEVGAAWASGALDARDALLTAFHRSRLQQRVAGQGAMLAVGLGPDEALEWVQRHGPGIAVAAINSARSVTLAGARAPLERVAAELASAHRFQRFLQVEVPYHSPLMDPLRGELLDALAVLRPNAPRLPIYSTVSGRRMAEAERHDATYWWNNVRGSVRFADALRAAVDDGHGMFIEVGPHPVLASSIRDVLSTAGVKGEVLASLVREAPEQETMSSALGRLHVLGVDVAWRGYFGPGAYVGAPRMPWQRKVYWEESVRSASRRRAFGGHPLLVDSEPGLSPAWTAELSLASVPYLADHHAAGSLLFPGAGHVELALAARHALTGDARCRIEELELSTAVVLSPETSPRLRLGFSAETSRFVVQRQEEGQQPVVCARGRLVSSGRGARVVDVAAHRARLPESTTPEALYASLARGGLRYGPSFRVVSALQRAPGEVFARLDLPAGVDARGYHLHPVLLDGAFHSLIAAAMEDADHDIVPTGIDCLEVLAPPGRTLLSHGRLRSVGEGTLRGDITLLSEDGVVVAEVTGFTCRLLPRSRSDDAALLERSVYSRRWERFEPSEPAEREEVTWVVMGDSVPPSSTTKWHPVADATALEATLAGLPENAKVRLVDLRWLEAAPEREEPVARGVDAADALLRCIQSLRPGRIDRYYVVTTRAESVESTPEVTPAAGWSRTGRPEHLSNGHLLTPRAGSDGPLPGAARTSGRSHAGRADILTPRTASAERLSRAAHAAGGVHAGSAEPLPATAHASVRAPTGWPENTSDGRVLADSAREVLRPEVAPAPARDDVGTPGGLTSELVTHRELPSISLAPLLGLARTAMTERPDLRLTVVDLDAEPSSLEALLLRLSGLGVEQEVAEREGLFHAVRLVRDTLTSSASLTETPPLEPVPEGMGYELVLGKEGQLDTLGFVAKARRVPGPGEVELEVESTALGFKDVMKALGLLSSRVTQDTYIGEAIGMEGAGRISAVGEGVTGFAVGDRVYGVAPGFIASHVVLPAGNVVKLPAHLSFEQGANLIVFLTVYHALMRVARLRRGERILIHGATGGVGLAAIEVARWCGADIIATAGSEEKRQYLREQGLTQVSHSRDTRFAEDVRAWTDGRGVDVVLSFSPGEVVSRSVECLAPFGRFIELGKASFEQDELLRLRPFNENLTYAAVDFDRLLRSRPDEVRELYQEVMARFEDGGFRPLPSRSWPASQTEDAFRTLARGQHIGKVCICMKDAAVRVRPSERRTRLSPEASYLVTGGLGGFGLEVARWLVEQGARHLVLVSRRGAGSEEARDALEALRARGVSVLALSADVARYADLERAFTRMRAELPPLRGVFHCAVTLDDKPLARLDRASLERVMAAKAQGAWNLHLLTRDLSLDHLVLFSSISSLIGNAGQGSYVAANAFLDQLAVYRRKQGWVATTLQWGALGEAGLVARNASVAQHLEHLGLRGLSTRAALQGLGQVLDAQPVQRAIADVDWGRWGDALVPWSGARRLSRLLGTQADSPGPTQAGASRPQGLDAITQSLARIVARVMRTQEGALSTTQPLRELGMDSIMALEIVTAVEREQGRKLSTVEVVSGPSVRELATRMLGPTERDVLYASRQEAEPTAHAEVHREPVRRA
ncbi:SDR family NAD(P)-dependent oxidoreductase [Myxococcus sp. K38C18041901]|uniref:type I polyketide synthase n=1 Tax=Myxococcus guangdongensis TaxID=2906760 RepID=UPI0020A75B27|nr:type I polyketide synthase [Myxococcus guangdongensis]MCP3061223.1 SDR family NAD(P)-dependent oxidoreductase [Myxococcus guangdongensis]